MANERTLRAILESLEGPSDDLRSMRRVMEGIEPDCEREIWMKKWRDDTPTSFMESKRKAEEGYRKEQIYRASLAEERAARASGGEEEDEGTERAIEMAQEWLRAQGEK